MIIMYLQKRKNGIIIIFLIHNYYVSYNSYEDIKIPSKVFNKDEGYIALAFSFMIPVNNELGSCGGTGVALKYQKKDNYKISIYKFE